MHETCEVIMLPTSRKNKNVLWKLISSDSRFGSLGLPEDETKHNILHYGDDNIFGAWKYGSIQCQHLYIASNGKIEVGDWVVYDVSGYNDPEYDSHFLGRVLNTDEVGEPNAHYRVEKRGDTLSWHVEYCKKVIAATDVELELPSIPDSFIREYANTNGEITNVDVEIYEESAMMNKIISPFFPIKTKNNAIIIK